MSVDVCEAVDGGPASPSVAAASLAGVNFAPVDRTTVSEDHSLEEFASTDSTGSDDTDTVDDVDDPGDPGDTADDAADSAGAEGDDAADPPADAVDPADPTYDYSPDGASCGACGERVTRRWRDDGDYVCVDCKEW
ncbi:DUF7573 domain-containing protein [Halobaculum saliterrae]|uniref:DUF7573 domain-containing protein n=1 Tax=Halobaculum saliterrae TaxID=2073113 RepID=UPI001F2A329E|nr:hypothetical protein [Halobaculum saliterrae]